MKGDFEAALHALKSERSLGKVVPAFGVIKSTTQLRFKTGRAELLS
jgi:hypothetical protein